MEKKNITYTKRDKKESVRISQLNCFLLHFFHKVQTPQQSIDFDRDYIFFYGLLLLCLCVM